MIASILDQLTQLCFIACVSKSYRAMANEMIFLDGSHCKCESGDLVMHQRVGQEDRKLRVVNTQGKPKDGKAPLWWLRHCESYGDVFTKIEE